MTWVTGPLIRRTIKFFLEVFGSAVAGAVLVMGLLIWRLSAGPISLAFLSPHFQQALSAEDGSFSVALEDTVLTWAGWERTLDIRLIGVTALDGQGEKLASVPEVSVSLSARGLLHGMVAPTRIEVWRPDLHAVLSPDGAFSLGLRNDTGTGESDLLSRVITDLLSPPNPNRAMGYLTRVNILDSDVIVDDRYSHAQWHARDTNISFTRDQKGIKGKVSINLDMGDGAAPAAPDAPGDGYTHFDSEFVYDVAGQRIDLGMTFTGIRPEKFAERVAALAPLHQSTMPMSGTVAMTLDLNGHIPFFGFDLSAGEGQVALPGLYKEPITIVQASLRGRFEDNFDRLYVDDAFFDLGREKLNATALVSRMGEDSVLQGEAVMHDVPFNGLERLWPEGVGDLSRNWVIGHLSQGLFQNSVPSTRSRFRETTFRRRALNP